MISVGSTVKVLVDYRPVRDDEVGVSRGDLVQVVEVNPGRGYKVRKPQQQTEGWVPTYVLNLLTGGPRRPAWTFKKFRKPSFSNRKDSSGKLVGSYRLSCISSRGRSLNHPLYLCLRLYCYYTLHNTYTKGLGQNLKPLVPLGVRHTDQN